MPDDPTLPYDPNRRVGTGLAGETTRSAGDTILPDTGQRPLEIIGDFEVIGQLGKGGMGAVYRARQISLNRQVALKILPTSLEADPEYVSRFQREARVAASLSHANLVKVYSAGQAGGCHYIAMELIEGETLGQWLKRGAMPPLEALRIILDVTRALECGWRTAQLIHRDIKPGNIFLSQNGDVKLGDLGLAKVVGGDTTGLTQTGTAMGTPHYISPEQARGDKDLDFRADIYSLGCTLYQMLTGQTPYGGTEPMVVMVQHINAPPPAILKVLPQCPIPLARLVSKMLKKSRRERHTTYEELIAQIEAVRAQLDPTLTAPAIPPAHPPQTPLPVTPPSGTTRAAKKPPLAVYGGAAAVAVALIVGWLVWPKEEKLTAAQRWARDHAGEKKSEAVGGESGLSTSGPDQPPLPAQTIPPAGSAAATPAHFAATHSAEPKAMKLWDSPEKIPTSNTIRWENDALRLDGSIDQPAPVSRDAIMRASIQMNPDAKAPQIGLRHGGDAALHTAHKYIVGISRASGKPAARLNSVVDGAMQNIGEWPLPRVYGKEEWARFELRAVGDELTVSVDGQILGRIRDTSISGPGGAFLFAQANGYFRDIEYVPLDGVPASAAAAPEPLRDRAMAAPADFAAPPAAEPKAIKLWDTLEKLPKSNTVRWENDALRLEGGIDQLAPASRDAIIRASILMNPDARSPQIGLRQGGNGAMHKAHNYDCGISRASGHPTVKLNRANDGDRQTIGEWPLPRAYGGEEWARFELRAVGDELTVSVDGQVLGRVRDASVSGPGGVSLYAQANAYFRDIEYVPLDGVPASAAAAAEPWRDWLSEKRAAGGFATLPELVDEGTQVRLAKRHEFGWVGVRFRDGSVRATWSTPSDESTYIYFRRIEDPTRHRGLCEYKATIEKSIIRLEWVEHPPEGIKYHLIQEWPLPPGFDRTKEFTLEARALGDRLTVLLNDVEFGTVQDATLSESGTIGFNASEGTRVRKFEFRNLDAAANAVPAPATASQDAPFVNTLGMKFVPVPITGGPTGGQRVLFSVWETRVQDYGAFAGETRRQLNKPAIEQGPTHPMVDVSWSDAQAFCVWLTEHERQTGKIGSGDCYRLPTDHEWSCAAGIGEQEDATKTPGEKDSKLANVFVWGNTWPPPPGVLASHPHATTVPVGSLAANRLGLYDLAGGAWEECADRLDGSQGGYVLRGGSWRDGDPSAFNASRRIGREATYHTDTTGFRVVLAPAR